MYHAKTNSLHVHGQAQFLRRTRPEFTAGAQARQVYDLRDQASLTQKQLAELVGTTETVIDDLEEADYEGDALSMLVQIATALNKRIDVRFEISSVGDPATISA